MYAIRSYYDIVFAPGADTLGLLREALCLLEPGLRWRVSFNTYFTKLAGEMNCDWRFCLSDCRSLAAARRQGRTVIDLTAALPPAPDGEWVRFARGQGARPHNRQADRGAAATALWNEANPSEAGVGNGRNNFV